MYVQSQIVCACLCVHVFVCLFLSMCAYAQLVCEFNRFIQLAYLLVYEVY